MKKFLYLGLGMLCLLPMVNAPMALLLGFTFSLIFGNPFNAEVPGLSKKLLQGSIIGLGFGLNAMEAFEVSKDGFSITFLTIAIVFLVGWAFNKGLGIDKITALLISSGTAICGGSAIATVSPILKAKGEQISIAMATVFVLNAVALLIFPYIGQLLELSQYQFGLWAATAIHDTSSVVGAAEAYGVEALEVATTVKLSRALWIIPVSLVVAFFYDRSSKIKVPSFIAGFVGAILFVTVFPQFDAIYGAISAISSRLLVATLFLIGSTISLSRIKTVGMKSMVYGTTLWVVISVLSLFIINQYY